MSVFDILQGIHSHHFFAKVLVGIVEPFEILTLNNERESIVLLDGPVLDFVELVKLSLKHIEIPSLLGVKINVHFLIALKGVHDFVKLWLVEEISVITDSYTLLNLVQRKA